MRARNATGNMATAPSTILCTGESAGPAGAAVESAHRGHSGFEAALFAMGRAEPADPRDPIELSAGFAEELASLFGGMGVVLEVVAPSGERFVVSRGTPSGFVESVAPMLSPNRLGQPTGAIDVMEDIDRAPELAGTLLHEALHRAGVRGWFSMALTADRTNSYGTLVVLVPAAAKVDDTGRLAVQNLMKRLVLELERNWLASSARVSSARFEAIFNSLPDAVAIVAPDGRIAAVNGPAADFIGLGRDGMIGREFAECFGSEVASRAACEVSVRRGDGSQAVIDCTARPIDGGHGTIVVMRDVTRSRAAEARLRESDRLAVIGSIAAGLGHDVNNVLLPVRAHLNAIGSGGGKLRGEALDLHLSQIRAGLAHLQNLADSLHGLALDPESDGDGNTLTALDAWWRRSRPILEKTLHRRAQLDSFVDESAPEVGAPPHALTRVLLNILVNAAEAMPEGRPQSACRVVVRIRGMVDSAVIEVTDNGCGMNDEVRRRAFDAFFTTKTRGLGTGLGLPLVRRVVERAGGRVEIESRVGLGTTVRLVLPAVQHGFESVRPSAFVRLDDGRCAAIIRGYLDVFGVDAETAGVADDADMFVTDSNFTSLEDARRWCTVHEPSLLVLVGAPPAASAEPLAQLGVTVIPDGSDIRAIEQGLLRALRLQVDQCKRKEANDV